MRSIDFGLDDHTLDIDWKRALLPRTSGREDVFPILQPNVVHGSFQLLPGIKSYYILSLDYLKLSDKVRSLYNNIALHLGIDVDS